MIVYSEDIEYKSEAKRQNTSINRKDIVERGSSKKEIYLSPENSSFLQNLGFKVKNAKN